MTLCIEHQPLLIISLVVSLPRPPGESLSAYQEHTVTAGDLDSIIQVESIVQASIDGCTRSWDIAENIKRAKVSLGLFV